IRRNFSLRKFGLLGEQEQIKVPTLLGSYGSFYQCGLGF
ncbi:unnamed protein product, partial [marine sediment metagenome]